MKTISWASGLGCDVPLESISTKDLFQYHANAAATSLCIGHHKGQKNEILMSLYAEELARRHLVVPKNASKYGKFNGRGSY